MLRRFRNPASLMAYLFLVVSVYGTFVRADSALNFPRLSFEPNTLTGLAIVNPSLQDAVVTITAYGPDGKPLAGVGLNNPVQITVKANQQSAKLTSELFGNITSSVTGWFQATSSVDGLTGFFLFLNTAQTFFDGADLPAAAPKIVFNQIRIGSGYTTEVDIVNPSLGPTTVSVQLAAPGLSAVAKTVLLPAKGMARLDPADFFGIGAVAPGAFVTVTSDLDVAGFEVIRAANGDLLGLNARNASEQLRTIYFPQMAVLGPWKTEVGLVNYSAAPAVVTLYAYKPDGTLYGPPSVRNNPVTRALGAGAGLREDVESMFGFSGGGALDGWIKVECTAAVINGYVSYGMPSTGSVAAVAGSGVGQRRAILSHIATAQGYFTGVALLNPSSLSANFRILALRPDGQILGSFNGVLRPGERVSRLINEFIPQSANQAGGLIWIKSDEPLYLTELFGTGNTLANVPAQLAPDGFNPDAALRSIMLVPSLAPLQTGAAQNFLVQNFSGSITWKVNGVPGGNATLGTISPASVYNAPLTVPVPQVLTVTAEPTPDPTLPPPLSLLAVAGASVDVLQKEPLVMGLGVVQSIAYLSSLRKLYVAELSSAETMASSIFEVSPPGVEVPIANYSSEAIPKIIPFVASNGTEYLLLAGQTSGKIMRLNPVTKQSVSVASGLNQPSTLVVDSATGNLLVVEADKISIVSKASLESPSGLKEPSVPTKGAASDEAPKLAIPLLSVFGVSGIATDACTGDIYFSDSNGGSIRKYVRLTGQLTTVVADLSNPRQLVAVYRSGVSCPFSVQLLVVERGPDRISLVVPAGLTAVPWVPALITADVAFLPGDNPFGNTEGILFSELTGLSSSKITLVRIAGLYKAIAPNPGPPLQTGVLYYAKTDGSAAAVDVVTRSQAAAIPPQSFVGVTQGFGRSIAFDPRTRLLWYAASDGLIHSINVDTLSRGPDILDIPDNNVGVERRVFIDYARRRILTPLTNGSVAMFNLSDLKLAGSISADFFSDGNIGLTRHFASDVRTGKLWYAAKDGSLREMDPDALKDTGRVISFRILAGANPGPLRHFVIDQIRNLLLYVVSDGSVASINLTTLTPDSFSLPANVFPGADLGADRIITYDIQ